MLTSYQEYYEDTQQIDSNYSSGENMIISIIRTIILYIFVISAIRIMGKRQLSDMQTSELVITMIIADIASIPMQNTAQPLLSGIVPVIILACIEIFISILMLKSPLLRKAVCGKPEIIIADGKLKQDMLRKLRLSTEDLSVLLRQQGIFSIDEVQYCIIETNGQISVLPKVQNRTPTIKDLNLLISDKGLNTVVLSDGEYLTSSMNLCDIDKEWIEKILSKENLKTEDIMMMTVNRLKEYSIIRKY